MPTTAKLATFAVGALVAFGAAFGLGRAVGPIGGEDAPAHPGHPEATTTVPGGGSHAGHVTEGAGS